jgi:hypothetical protein
MNGSNSILGNGSNLMLILSASRHKITG